MWLIQCRETLLHRDERREYHVGEYDRVNTRLVLFACPLPTLQEAIVSLEQYKRAYNARHASRDTGPSVALGLTITMVQHLESPMPHWGDFDVTILPAAEPEEDTP